MNRNFKLILNPQIYVDIQHQVNYYHLKTKSHALGKRFTKVVLSEIKRLKKHAFQYEVKYDDIRCLPIPNFPFRVHFRINEQENIVKIEAIISTHENPEKWIERTS